MATKGIKLTAMLFDASVDTDDINVDGVMKPLRDIYSANSIKEFLANAGTEAWNVIQKESARSRLNLFVIIKVKVNGKSYKIGIPYETGQGKLYRYIGQGMTSERALGPKTLETYIKKVTKGAVVRNKF